LNLMGLTLAVCFCVVGFYAVAMQGQRASEPHRFVVAKDFAPGGALDFTVNAGDVRIVRNLQPSQVRLEVAVTTRQLGPAEAQKRWVKRMEVNGSHATIDLQLPMGRSAGLVTIYVPAATSLVAKMHAGRLTVGGVKGNKDLRVGSGVLTLRVADPAAYQHVRAEVRLGELSDGIFHGKQNGMLGRTMVAEGKGQYQLLLHVGTGELVLTGEDGGL